MAGITKEDLRREITAIFKDADLTSMSAKKLRQQLEKKLDIDLSDRKKEVDDIMMECLEEKRDGKGSKGGESKKRKEADDDDEEEEEEEEEEEDEEEEKGKRSAAKKKPPPKKQKKGSSDESDEGSDDNASDEEYNPGGKKGKGGAGGRKGAKGGKKKAKGSDSDEGSDEDWAKSRRGGGGGGGGGGNSTPAKKAAPAKRGSGGGGGYTRAYNLTPELAALVGCEAMARHEVVKKIWAIIKGRNLFDPKNKQFAICDDELLKVFGVKRFRTFGMMKYLKNHFID